MKWFASLILIAAVGWVGYSYLTVHNLGEPQYVVVESREGYEIRQYDAYTVIETTVRGGDIVNALKEGFILLEDYTEGDNLGLSTFPLTLPVIEHNDGSGVRVIQMAMGRGVSSLQLPKPNNPQVRVVSVPPHTAAVLSFSWWASAAQIDEQKRNFVSLLQAEGITAASIPLVAFYSESLSSPYEIIVPIRVR